MGVPLGVVGAAEPPPVRFERFGRAWKTLYADERLLKRPAGETPKVLPLLVFLVLAISVLVLVAAAAVVEEVSPPVDLRLRRMSRGSLGVLEGLETTSGAFEDREDLEDFEDLCVFVERVPERDLERGLEEDEEESWPRTEGLRESSLSSHFESRREDDDG